MAMTQETVSARVKIQANSCIAHPLLASVLAMGRADLSQDHCELERRKLTQHTLWRLIITSEMGMAQASSEEET
jgi:hypothetical protein